MLRRAAGKLAERGGRAASDKTDTACSFLGRFVSASASDDLMEVVASKIPAEQVR